MEWRPIETAPKDGAVFDVWCPEHAGYTIANCRYVDDVLKYRGWHGWFRLNATCTHWRDAPEPPEGA